MQHDQPAVAVYPSQWSASSHNTMEPPMALIPENADTLLTRDAMAVALVAHLTAEETPIYIDQNRSNIFASSQSSDDVR